MGCCVVHCRCTALLLTDPAIPASAARRTARYGVRHRQSSRHQRGSHWRIVVSDEKSDSIMTISSRPKILPTLCEDATNPLLADGLAPAVEPCPKIGNSDAMLPSWPSIAFRRNERCIHRDRIAHNRQGVVRSNGVYACQQVAASNCCQRCGRHWAPDECPEQAPTVPSIANASARVRRSMVSPCGCRRRACSGCRRAPLVASAPPFITRQTHDAGNVEVTRR